MVGSARREHGLSRRGLPRYLPLGFVALLLLSGCGFLPGTGPSASAVARQAQDADSARHVRLVDVTPDYAVQMLAADREAEQHRTSTQLAHLQDGAQVVPVMMYPGDTVDVTLWTDPVNAGAASSPQAGIKKIDLGRYTVDESGQLVLPYAGTVMVNGLTVPQAEQDIATAFVGASQFAHPQVSLVMQNNRHQRIIVTGAANHPVIVDWKTGGVTLGDVIAEAGGSKGDALNTNEVVIRRGTQRFNLSMKTALEASVPLYPGDVVVLEHSAAVHVQCLGGGWTKNTLQSFDTTPTLAAVVASGGGLGPAVAQGAAVYVLSQDHRTVYRVPWDTLSGLQASQSFPVQNGDTVYIATSPSVEFQQIVSILYSAAFPIGTFNALK